ncbi:hypothetical protein RhiirA5_380515 [Rhizophagus irregularis]|uniref:Phosphatidylglycerol/phosphatidylinositol transfer protein n=3 Tax=Rhizophagus irregularis TaxID=588596 RepID=U9SQY3_RHIID|nr:hypothetical protein GLOIN_2v1873252 [Rhizophagus irregularis DAOM 181602=DAOM 197198]EXX67357.1 hypothetical protein RirG_115060 [Rhizophagus irregularis DAOM 197198w]PKC03002.1 hypothetical protein RhiirA5_380515 [Rhizophagus irregularis]PKC55253.1 hypothetical protein RhiirA1_403032 [Rhizophagus irregularis]PKY30279.1 hypothetical protein RhiirB3_474756 [Rhizophagus irregularis]POG74962.1 hypothetical protein GLOIN_2v1873252 [Rhizophagus irregularis DAOM 181602=DAOM 197198]|eukprot:XP_025181828.1 hypothetical protein GLOIN_2v1873252 [Rhizophagus irregularis DAOM 181602=DAOM 197198]
MKQSLTFAVILLAMLSMINAFPLHKRKTEFSDCEGLHLDVKSMTPDPIQAGKNATFTISGDFTTHPLTSEFKQYIAIGEGFAYIATYDQDICSDSSVSSSDIPKCPVTDYNTTMTIQVPDYLDSSYVLLVFIWDGNYTSKGPEWLACARAFVGQ